MACRGAAWWVGGKKVLIGWLFVSEQEAQNNFRAITSETNLQKVLWSLVPLCDAADRLASCMLWGKHPLRAAPDTHTSTLRETLVELTIEATGRGVGG